MFSKIERLIARRYLFSSKREGFISVIAWFSFLGIALGVATLIIVMSVMNGFREQLFGSLVNMKGHITVQGASTFDLDQSIVQTIQSIPGVTLAYPLLEKQAIVLGKNTASGAMIQGMPAYAIAKRERIQLQHGAHLDTFKGDYVYVGRKLAESLNVFPGDKITLITQQSTPTAFGNIPKQKTFIVADIFSVGIFQFDKNYIFMPLETAQQFFKETARVSQIDVFSSHDDLTEQLCHTMQQVLPKNLRALDWKHSDLSIMHAVKMERNVMFLILALIILIASFNIISGLIMLVKDKTRDIAILRTMGATRQNILKIFFLTGASIGGIGTILGVGLGLSFALNIERIRQFLQNMTGVELFSEEIYFLTTLPSKVEINEVFIIICMGFSLSFLATLYPAWKAAQLDPVEGIKG